MRQTPVWIFDLDNTLHNASAHIFPHINRAMTEYVQEHLQLDREAANHLRTDYWHRYGATLIGLMRHHGTDPHHFLRETHRFEHLRNLLVFERALRTRLARLPGRKFVFSNGPAQYARTVLELMGLKRSFQAVFALEHVNLIPKPDPRAFRHLLRQIGEPAHRCILVEDSLENLRTAKRLGMRTVWVSRSHRFPAYVDRKLGNILSIQQVLSQ